MPILGGVVTAGHVRSGGRRRGVAAVPIHGCAGEVQSVCQLSVDVLLPVGFVVYSFQGIYGVCGDRKHFKITLFTGRGRGKGQFM